MALAQITPEQIAAGIDSTRPSNIAAAIARMINDGTLEAGGRMPTIRAISSHLGVSAGTVSAAWKTLRALQLVEARGRAGTYVLSASSSWLPPRYRSSYGVGSEVHLDLSTGTPDPLLLPSIRGALLAAGSDMERARVNSYLADPMIPELETLMRATWPYRPQRFTVVNGAMDGIIRTLHPVARFGDRIAVESPGYPPIFDICDQLGLAKVPITLDDAGPTVESVRAALDSGVRALIIQPRAQNPTGVSMTATRVRELAALIRSHRASTARADRLIVIEDDHSGQMSTTRDLSLGAYLPHVVVRIRSYSKSHGPDLRIAGLGGPARVVDAIIARRLMGAGWTSRVLQLVLVEMLNSPEAKAQILAASREYARRRRDFSRALQGHGIAVRSGDGLALWIPVADEDSAVNILLGSGIRTSRGSEFLYEQSRADVRERDHIRITIGSLRSHDIEPVAALVAHAARTP